MMQNPNSYDGPERRIHKVYVTKNTEYHVRRGVCVAVKPRQGSGWVERHTALCMRLEGHTEKTAMLPFPGPPKLGNRIYFANNDGDVLTSPVIAILRPPKKVVNEYPPE